MTKIGLKVDGYDIDEKATKRALDNGVISHAATDFRDYDNYIVAISTHRPGDMFQPFLDGLNQVTDRLREEGKKNALLAVESTIPAGFSRKIFDRLGHRLHVAHVPHRFYMQEKETHGVRQLRVLAGCEPCCVAAAEYLYGDVLHIPVYPVSSTVYAELSKITENTHRYLEIAFAEELKIYCDEYGLSYQELHDAVNTKWNEGLLEARAGIGGHCLPKDSQMYLNNATPVLKHSLITAAKLIDQEYRRHIDLNREKLQMKQEVEQVSPPDSLEPTKKESAKPKISVSE
jgi:UDP-N-acetyl-D-mannosaminuronic acid dehydrogenase